jgi:Family of unknown function (DUF6084)
MATTVPPPTTAPQLTFAVRDAAPLEHAAVPTLAFAIAVEAAGGVAVRSVLLDVQVQIAARRRAYAPGTHARLFEVFGPVAGWGTTLRTLLWTRATLVVPPFRGATTAQLPLPCSYDLEVLASRYLDALDGGEVPLEFLFSGTVFYAGEDGRLQVARISWEQEAEYRLPVAVWREALDRHFRGTAWLRLGKDRFDRLSAFKSRNAHPTWDAAIDALLPPEEGG